MRPLGGVDKVRLYFHPLGTFAIFVVFAFLVEWLVMAFLPFIVDPFQHTALASVVDSGILVLVLGPLVWVLFVGPLRRLIDLRTRVLNQVIEAQEDTLGRVSRDLHDGVGQSLAGLMMGLRAIEETSTEPQVKTMLRDIRGQGALAHEELRRMVRGLRPYQLDDKGLLAALQTEVESLRSLQPVRFELECTQWESRRWPQAVESALFRIAQEAISNSLRHGKPTVIGIRLERKTDGLLLEVTDNGGGFDAGAAWAGSGSSRPFGLFSMRERAHLLGGTLTVESSPGSRTLVRAVIPVQG